MAKSVVISLRTIRLLSIFIVTILSLQSALSQDRKGSLTLQTALSLTLQGSPELASFAWESRVRDGQVMQASLYPNPEIGVEVENFGGSGESARFDGAETALLLNQTVLLGGKRAKRMKAASLERNLARWDLEARRLDLIAETTKAFIDVLAAQERVALSEELAALAETVLDTTALRVEAGKVSPIEETKAKVAFSTSRIAQQQAAREVDASRVRLATFWGASEFDYREVKGTLDEISPIPSIEDFAGLISSNQDIGRWDAEMERRQALLALEKAGRIPDLTIGGGYRYLGETDDHAFFMQAGLPIPSFDRNQGTIMEAQHRLSQLEHQRKAAETRVLKHLTEAYQRLSAAFAEAKGLKADVLQGAQRAFDVAREGYQQGKFGYLDVLDAQRTLFEAEVLYIDSLAVYHRSTADVERLIGKGATLEENTEKPYKEKQNECAKIS